jgi:hypothetical protein
MVRGVVVVVFTIFLMLLGVMLGTAVLEPLGSTVGEFDSINNGPLDGDGVIDDVYGVVLTYSPLIVIGGIILWAFRWYLRQERFVGGRR